MAPVTRSRAAALRAAFADDPALTLPSPPSDRIPVVATTEPTFLALAASRHAELLGRDGHAEEAAGQAAELQQLALVEHDESGCGASASPSPATLLESSSARRCLNFLVPPPPSDPLRVPDLDFQQLKASPLDGRERQDVRGAYAELKREWRAVFERRRRVQGRTQQLQVELPGEGESGGNKRLRVSETGWMGVRVHPPSMPLRQLRKIPFDESAGPTVLATSDGLVLAVRAERLPPDLLASLRRFTSKIIDTGIAQELGSVAKGRGRFSQFTLGVTRSYTGIHLMREHTAKPLLVKQVLEDPDGKRLSGHMSGIYNQHYPRLHRRYCNADFANEDPSHSLRYFFGAFPLFTFNYADGSPVYCEPHIDWKNPGAGMCGILPYGSFNSRELFWLALPEIGVVLEMPEGVPLLIPSALLRHYNCHVVSAPSAAAVRAGHGVPRGSMVYYAQANYLITRELGMMVGEAEAKGLRSTFPNVETYYQQQNV